MTPLRVIALGSALLSSLVSAQSYYSSSNRVWAAVAFVNHGERTPEYGELQTVLTPAGAQQLLRQGKAFRSRYLANVPDLDSDAAVAIGSAPIENIQATVIDNDQLTILSQADEWVAAGAMAFFQGLYPATNETFNSAAGGDDLSHNLHDNATGFEYPLNGYQYPKVQTLSLLDSTATIIQGTVGCTEWEREMNANLTRQKDLAALADSSLGFYQQLFATPPLEGTIDQGEANFWHASDIYEYVNYMYAHNETVYGNLTNANDTLSTLQTYAITLEHAMTSDNTTNDDDPINILHTIAGRTLAQKVAEQFISNIGADGVDTKLTLMFGSLRPLLSYFALAGLLTRENLLEGPFSAMPEPGAAMVFELVGEDPDHPDSLPNFDDLMVRFYYRANTNDYEPFHRYSLFDSGFDGASIPYSAFVREMQDLGRNSAEWCSICKPGAAVGWCSAYPDTSDDSSDSNTSSSSNHHSSLNPAIAGLIGAIVMAAVFGLVALALFTLLGFRLQRSPPAERNSSLRGFKGAEKMASDPDLAVTKGGAGHERVGSWELRDDAPVTGGAGIVTSDFRKNADDDGISVMGEAPVKARESV